MFVAFLSMLIDFLQIFIGFPKNMSFYKFWLLPHWFSMHFHGFPTDLHRLAIDSPRSSLRFSLTSSRCSLIFCRCYWFVIDCDYWFIDFPSVCIDFDCISKDFHKFWLISVDVFSCSLISRDFDWFSRYFDLVSIDLRYFPWVYTGFL